MIDEMRLKETKSKAQTKANEICGEIEGALVHALVKAYRAGMDGPKGRIVFDAIQEAAASGRALYDAAIAQPEPRMSIKQRVVL